MKATLGRIVHVKYMDGRVISNGQSVAAAIVTNPWSGHTVNLTMLPDCGAPSTHGSVPPADSVASDYTGLVWFWPPREGA